MNNAVGDVQSMLVLGGTSDIAMATVDALIPGGLARVMLAGRSLEDLDRVGTRIHEAGVEVVDSIEWDAADPLAQQAFVDEAFTRGGDFDLVLLAAGVLGETGPGQEGAASAAPVILTNYAGSAMVALAAMEHLQSQGHGTMVVLSSVAAVRPRRSNFVYGSSKAGIDFLARGLSAAAEGTGAQVMVVRPGFVKTKMTKGLPPAPFSTDGAAVGSAIAAGLRSGRTVVWVPGILRLVAWVFRHLPAFAWKKVEGMESQDSR